MCRPDRNEPRPFPRLLPTGMLSSPGRGEGESGTGYQSPRRDHDLKGKTTIGTEAAHSVGATSERPTDPIFMRQALAMGERHLGLTAPNPSVGAVLVDETPGRATILARSVTAPGGRPHAERIALDAAGERARGATLFVTLEPCSHHGHTPPCAEAIIAAGIGRVVCAMQDPNPRVAGQGLHRLRQAGIEVVLGVMR